MIWMVVIQINTSVRYESEEGKAEEVSQLEFHHLCKYFWWSYFLGVSIRSTTTPLIYFSRIYIDCCNPIFNSVVVIQQSWMIARLRVKKQSLFEDIFERFFQGVCCSTQRTMGILGKETTRNAMIVVDHVSDTPREALEYAWGLNKWRNPSGLGHWKHLDKLLWWNKYSQWLNQAHSFPCARWLIKFHPSKLLLNPYWANYLLQVSRHNHQSLDQLPQWK